ncbi:MULTISPECIES: helix-turn-helix domain-containing protein [Cyanophyceae]|uniref:Helix-turn-helix domain-containing protein n=1 Tax=Leptolyngbya subtilissima DQ-A4 TaxID=2933933 RepID=A0ABV0K8S6_9CYAN|nr:helix-turn-helix transcriptional regulator [Nodosilinea sp. FACHB-141]MBD2110346.1 helix-turn-helix transcriptional regulator [Nodosilinea sp. FACHB-141]
MGKAGYVLKQVLEQYGITQYRFAATMGVGRNSVYRWCSGKIDPTGDTILEIVQVLKTMNPDAAEAFVSQYIGREIDE